MKLLVAQSYREREDSAGEWQGKTHACFDDGEGWWPVCGQQLRDPTSLWPVENGPVTCKRCGRLRLSDFRRVRRAIEAIERANG